MYGGAALNAAHVAADLIDGHPGARRAPAARRSRPARPPRAPTSTPPGPRLPSGEHELAQAGIAPLDAAAATDFYGARFARTTFDVNALTCRDASQRRTIIPYEAAIAFSLRSRYGQAARPCRGAEEHWHATPAGGRDARDGAAAARPTRAGSTRRCPRWRSPGARSRRPRATTARCCAPAGPSRCCRPCSGTASPGSCPGIALAEDDIHAPNERLALDRYELGTRIGAAILHRLRRPSARPPTPPRARATTNGSTRPAGSPSRPPIRPPCKGLRDRSRPGTGFAVRRWYGHAFCNVSI